MIDNGILRSWKVSKSLEALKLMTESLRDFTAALETVRSDLEDYELLCRELDLLEEEE